MSRSSLSLWKRVRHAYYQMTDGPEGMSEPQYVSLASEKICYVSSISMTNLFRLTKWILGLWSERRPGVYVLACPVDEL